MTQSLLVGAVLTLVSTVDALLDLAVMVLS